MSRRNPKAEAAARVVILECGNRRGAVGKSTSSLEQSALSIRLISNLLLLVCAFQLTFAAGCIVPRRASRATMVFFCPPSLSFFFASSWKNSSGSGNNRATAAVGAGGARLTTCRRLGGVQLLLLLLLLEVISPPRRRHK